MAAKTMFTTLNSHIETSGMQFLDILVATVSNRHQTVSACLKVHTFCFADVDKSARCVIQEIEEVFENRAHSCWIFKKLIIDCHLSTLHTPYFHRHFLNLSQATGRSFLRLSIVKITWIWQVDRLYFEPCSILYPLNVLLCSFSKCKYTKLNISIAICCKLPVWLRMKTIIHAHSLS